MAAPAPAPVGSVSQAAPPPPPPPPPPAPESERAMSDALARSESGAPPVGQPANDPGASGQPAQADPSASGSGVPGGDIVPSAIDAVKDPGGAIQNPTAAIEGLNSDGDQLVLSLTAEAKGQVPVPIGGVPIGIGAKGQYGYDITVRQVGDAPAPGQNGEQPSYDVTFDKNLLGGATVEPPVPGVDPAGELNLTSADSVTMNFATPEDAGRAVQSLERLAAAETLRDLGNAATPGLSNPAANPLPEGDGSLSGTPPTEPLAREVGPSDADMAFLRDNITSYTTTLGVQERGKVAAKFANVGIEPRLDANQQISRTVEVPRDGEPGRLTYTLSGDVQASTKEKLTLGAQQFDQLEVGYTPQNIMDHGNVRSEVSISWDLPADRADPSISGRPVPELGALSGDGLGAPSELSAKFSFDGQVQSPTDLSRTDFTRGSLAVSVQNPADHAGPALNSFLSGDLRGAFGQMGEDFSVTATQEDVRRDGIEQQHELGFEVADVAEAKVSLIGEIGVDDSSNRRVATFTGADLQAPGDAPPATPVEPPAEPVPTETPGQMVVTPRDGLNVRGAPSIEGPERGVLQHGTFVQPTGARQTDATGREWVEVSSTDVADTPVQGWVDGQYLQSHEQGGMDAEGRFNPDLKAQGYEERTVQPGQTVWDIAGRNGANFQETLELNSGHLINPGMVFPGDKVYIPGTANPAPPPAAPPQPEPQPPAQPPASGSGESGPSGPPGPSGSESGEPPAQENGVDPDPSTSGSQDPSTSGAPETAPVAPPADPATPAARTDAQGQNLEDILANYQVPTDTRPNVDWSPGGLGGLPLVGDKVPSQRLTQGEADVMDGIFPNIGKLDAMKNAYETASSATYQPGATVDGMTSQELNDGHQDAFRHAYWNALMGSNVGQGEAERFATAHEANPEFENPAAREAMDLYNNEQGRRIAAENPDASDEELAGLVRDAISNGEMVVVGRDGNLAWSDEVAFGEHGRATGGEGAPVLPPVEDASQS